MHPLLRIAGSIFVGASLAGGLLAANDSLFPELTAQGLPPTETVITSTAIEPGAASLDTAVVSVAAYRAGFFALAGRSKTAKEILDQLAASDRDRAVEMIFAAIHPIADSGDEKSAGPVMELVVHYQPAHFMALYHAGMAAYATGRNDVANRHLANFLEYYHENDGWRTNAIDVLRKLDVSDAR